VLTGAPAWPQLHILGMVLRDSQTDQRLAARAMEGKVGSFRASLNHY